MYSERIEKITRIVYKIIFWCAFLYAVYCSVKAFLPGNVPIRFFYLLQAVVFGGLSGSMFCRIYLPKIVERFSFGLLMPRRYLKEAPLVLSPFEGLIAAGEYNEAEKGLVELNEAHPGRAEIICMLVRCYRQQKRVPEMIDCLERYFRCPERSASPAGMELLMTFSDEMIQQKNYAYLSGLLRAELRSARYSVPEKKLIQSRIDYVSSLTSEE